MYKIMIVDDEDIVRRSIVQRINWAAIGYEAPYQACNGLVAYDLALKVKPDLVFADIKMPIMNGLELANKLKETLPDTHIVIFSGHDEFTYAQESIKLGVLDYILKPLGSATLTKKFIEIRKQLDEKQTKLKYITKMKDQLHKSLPLLKESFLNGLVCSPGSSIYSKQRMDSIDLHLGNGPYMIVIIEPVFSEKDTELIDVFLFGLKNILVETMGTQTPYFTDASSRIVIILSYDTNKTSLFDKEIIIEAAEVLQKAFLLHLNIGTTIGLGSIVTTMEALFSSYNDALSAIDCKYNIGIGKVYDFADLNDFKSEFYYPIEESRSFIAAVKANNKIDIKKASDHLSSVLAHKESLSLANLKFIFIELTTDLTKLLAESKKSSDDLWRKTLTLYRTIEDYTSINTVASSLETIAYEIAGSLSEISLSSRKSVVTKATDYIQSHYSDEAISLKSVAQYVCVSSGYLSAIFKAENGINFNAFLTRTRMEKAKQMLATTDMNIYDIAYNTGHANPHYFSISFKKYTKQSPSEYRNLLHSQ